ncbi:MAG: thiol-activated cytolysin family protein [Bacteroidota bacterium]
MINQTIRRLPTSLSQLITIILFSWLFLTACSEEEGDGGGVPEPEEESFDQVIDVGGNLEPVTQSEEVVEETESNEVIDGEVWNCTTTTYSALAPGGGSNGFPLFNPNASVIYPGSLLQGKSLKQATPDVIAVDRSGGTISYDLNNGNLASSFTVEEVAKSSIQNAMNQIIASAPDDLPANFVFKYSQVQSEQALALELGIDYESAFVDVSSDFSFSSGSSLNRILVELNQSFYTMSFDIPTSLDGLFAPSVTPNDLKRYVQEGNPATYISDVTYGRIYYMLIESTSSYTEMETQIQASFSGVVNSADVDISDNSLSELENLKIKVMAFGGEASTSLLTVGETDLNRLVTLLAESTTISTGLPISYVVRSVATNQIVSVQLATEYDVTNCEPAPPGGEPPYTAHWRGQVLDQMGPVGAAFSRKGTEFILISEDGKQFMRSNVSSLEGPFPIDELGVEAPPFDIGAACAIDGNDVDDSWIMVMDITGSQWTYLRPNGTYSSNGPQPVADLADGTNPFALNGVGAMMFNYKDPMGPASRWMINQDGTAYSLYLNNPRSFGSVQNIESWSGGGLPFEEKKVGAGIGFYLGQKQFFVLFNKSGTQYCISGDVFGTGSHGFIGPFDL